LINSRNFDVNYSYFNYPQRRKPVAKFFDFATGPSHFYLALQPLRESRDAAGGGDHADAGTVRLGRPILPSSLYLGIALIIGYL